MTSKIIGPKVLLISKDKKLLHLLAQFFPSNIPVKQIRNLKEGINHALTNKYNFLLINTDLSNPENTEFIQRFRSKNRIYPILIIGPNNETSEIAAYNLGVNIYHSKPIHCELLKAQIGQLGMFFNHKVVFETGAIVIDIESRTMTIHERKVKFTPKEFIILCILIKAEGKIISKEILHAHICNYNKDSFDATIDTHISRMRNKIRKILKTDFILTEYQTGYYIDPQYFKRYGITKQDE